QRSSARQRVIEKTSGIAITTGYGMAQMNRDLHRNAQLVNKRIKSPYAGLSPSEDRENALLTARVKAFAQSPEWIGRQRISNLQVCPKITAEESEELQQLLLKYPPLPWPDCEPIFDIIEKAHT